MIARVLRRGNDIRGLVGYLMGPGRAEEHTNPRVIAAGEGIEVGKSLPLSPTEVGALGTQLQAPVALFQTEVSGGNVYHLTFSNPVGDRELSDAEWSGIATEAMDRLGFTTAGSGKAPCPWVAIHHGRSAEGNDHLHVAVMLVREDGGVAAVSFDHRKLQGLAKDFEARYGLSVVEGRGKDTVPGVTRSEAEAARRRGRSEADRVTLSRQVRGAATASQDEAELVRRLRAQGVLCRPRYGKGGQNEVVGYSVARRPVKGQAPIWFGGGKLAKDLVLPRLRERWEDSPGARGEAVAEWKATRAPTRSGPEQGETPESYWAEAAACVERACARLATIAPGEEDRWASVARETAGVLSAWSRRVEGDHPGPLARAADALSRSAQDRKGGPRVTREEAVADFRGVAVVVAQGAMSGSAGAMGWVMLARQLTRTMEAIAAAHRARDEARQAQHLAGSVAAEMEDLARRFEDTSPQELAASLITSPHRDGEMAGAVPEEPGEGDGGLSADDLDVWASLDPMASLDPFTDQPGPEVEGPDPEAGFDP